MMIKNKTLIIILICFFAVNTFAQQCDSCKRDFKLLLIIKDKSEINSTDLEMSWKITKNLYNINYTDYIDSVLKGTSYVSHSLTRVFSDICLKTDSILGVNYYFKYLSLTNGSSEEERSFALERLFVKYPEIVLNKIGDNKEWLNYLTWGFINNRYYGAVNPYEKEDYSAMTIYEDSQKPILNKENCREIFFETNPILETKYSQYRYQIDFIINTAIENLKENY